jgi:class 3 adenylate cyclase
MASRASQVGEAAREVPGDLRRARPWSRFPGQVEADYQVWYVEQTRPQARIMASLTIPFWIALPFFVVAWVDTPVDPGIFWVPIGVHVPLLVVGLVSTYTRANRYQVAITAWLLLVIGLDSLFVIDRFFTEVSQAGLLAAVMWVNMLAPFARLPFRTTTALTVAFTAVGGTLLFLAARDQHTSSTLTWPYGVLLLAGLSMIPGFALISEEALRDRFVDERLIARQRDELVASRALLRRYLPPAVADRLEQGDDSVDEPRRRRVTIFFSDVVGFTELADRLDPEALAEIVNAYLGSLADVIDRHGGTLNEFAGDGVMALFGAPEELEPAQQVFSALAAARELQQSLPLWSRDWYRLGITEDLRARVGISTGSVSVGTFGSRVRATYTGIGLQTNIAARVQARCEPGRILLAGTSWHLVRDTVPCVSCGEVEVKGVHLPVAMYEPETGETVAASTTTVGA